MQNLQINPQRLWDTLMETAQIGATAKGGICRLTLTDLDRQVRDWFKAQCEALGCTVAVDEVGNMFARRPGKKENLRRRSPWARISTPSRPAASSTARSACSARSKRCAPCMRPATRPTPRRDRQLDQRGRLAFRAGDARLRRLCRRVHARLRLWARRPRRQDLRRRAQAHRLPGQGQGRRPQIRRHVRAAHRAGSDPRGRGPHDRHRAGRAGHALVRGQVTGQAAHTGATPMRLRKNALLGARA